MRFPIDFNDGLLCVHIPSILFIGRDRFGQRQGQASVYNPAYGILHHFEFGPQIPGQPRRKQDTEAILRQSLFARIL